MRCNICDKELSDKEVVYNEELQAYEPCTYCLDVALDAAYSNGFQKEDDEFVLIEDLDESFILDKPYYVDFSHFRQEYANDDY